MYKTVLILALVAAPALAQDAASIVFVYAPRLTPAKKWMPILFDGQPAAALRQGFFFAVHTKPGRHVLSAEEAVPVSIESRVGEQVFVRLDWHHDVTRAPIPVFKPVAASRAAAELRYLSYVEPKRIQAPTVAPSDPRPPETKQLRERP